MINWQHQLGSELIKRGALSYIISDEGITDLHGEGSKKQLVDMVVFYKDHIQIIELKEKLGRYRKGVNFKQIQRYKYLCDAFKGKTEFWVFLHWKKHGYVVGSRINTVDSINFYAIENDNDKPHFYVAVGKGEATMVEKKIDFILKIKEENKYGM